ncbi:SH3 domain-containing protein [Streptomyces sp. NPDC058642]|uniref:SH3 domain-containing protein n=1 Tax=Streptomyces sp. NPDC058642 TaxID=3346572 RepID=UPI00365BDBC1
MPSLKRRSVLLAGAAGAFLTVLGTASVASAASYSVVPGYKLNVRSGPGTGYAVVAVLPEGATVNLVCQTPGETITGPLGTSNIWDKLSNNGYVSDTYVRTGADGYVTQRCPGS